MRYLVTKLASHWWQLMQHSYLTSASSLNFAQPRGSIEIPFRLFGFFLGRKESQVKWYPFVLFSCMPRSVGVHEVSVGVSFLFWAVSRHLNFRTILFPREFLHSLGTDRVRRSNARQTDDKLSYINSWFFNKLFPFVVTFGFSVKI